MTPLAYQITKELTRPSNTRSAEDHVKLQPRMWDIHCFECSQVLEAAKYLAAQMPEKGMDERSTFLPAPKTWIEYRKSNGLRIGFLLVDKDGLVDVKAAIQTTDGWRSFNHGQMRLDYTNSYELYPSLSAKREFIAGLSVKIEEGFEILLAMLAFINTPRLVGRRQHMPHKGLERRLVAQRGLLGKFPLHAWTEIKLDISETKDASADGSHEAHYTGERALHFCRAHLRVRLGKLEVVRSHWRGDASLGIKRSRYKLSH